MVHGACVCLLEVFMAEKRMRKNTFIANLRFFWAYDFVIIENLERKHLNRI